MMMTTMAALMGALPLCLAGSVGARRQLGFTVLGGLFVSQLVTLYLTPVFYLYMAALERKLADLPARLRALFGAANAPSDNGRKPERA